MSDVFFSELGIQAPDHHLDVGSGSHAEQTARVMIAFEPLVAELQPDVVVVVGDVNSTMACAIVAAKAGALVAHVEAGLRSRDWGMPEEVNRVVTDKVSDLLLAPSPDAVDNLRAEGFREDQIELVGNVMVDTLLANVVRARQRPVLDELSLRAGEYALATLHRPANVDDQQVLEDIVEGLTGAVGDLPLVFPVHPRTKARLATIPAAAAIRTIDPLGYLDFVALEAQAAIVFTDSGGVQEETTVLGVPCLTLRENTERPITVTHGTNRVVGRTPERIIAAAKEVLRDGISPCHPTLWDGRAGDRVADAIIRAADRAAAGSRLHPTAVVEVDPLPAS
jgi:UDP-N-acetylglucosamine 2-epimerase (non-hydrolysing)